MIEDGPAPKPGAGREVSPACEVASCYEAARVGGVCIYHVECDELERRHERLESERDEARGLAHQREIMCDQLQAQRDEARADRDALLSTLARIRGIAECIAGHNRGDDVKRDRILELCEAAIREPGDEGGKEGA